MPYIFSQRLTDDLTAVERTVTLIDVTEPWWQPSGMYTPRQRTSAEVAALPVYRNFVLERTTRHQNRRVVSERVGQIAMPQSKDILSADWFNKPLSAKIELPVDSKIHDTYEEVEVVLGGMRLAQLYREDTLARAITAKAIDAYLRSE